MPLIDNYRDNPADLCVDWMKLTDIRMIVLCAGFAGAEDWEDVRGFDKARIETLRMFLELPNGTRSHDDFVRTFA